MQEEWGAYAVVLPLDVKPLRVVLADCHEAWSTTSTGPTGDVSIDMVTLQWATTSFRQAKILDVRKLVSKQACHCQKSKGGRAKKHAPTDEDIDAFIVMHAAHESQLEAGDEENDETAVWSVMDGVAAAVEEEESKDIMGPMMGHKVI